jgi:heavy metal sensor kinase
MRRLRTLRGRFALWTAVLLLAVLSVFSLYIYQSMASRLASGVDESLTLVGAQVVAGLDIVGNRLVSSESFDDEPENVDLRQRGYTVWVTRLDGQLIHAFGPYQDLALPAGETASAAAFATLTEPKTGDQIRVHVVPAQGEGQPVATVQVARSLEDTKDTLGGLLTTLLIGVPGLVAAAAAGGYLLAARALAPIDRITQTARRISAEDLSSRLNLPAVDDEVGRLAVTFDEMLARLEMSFKRERQFIGDASHELRTPLSAMQAILDTISSRRRSPAEYERALIDLIEESDRLRSLTDDLLTLAHGGVQGHDIQEAVDLSTLLADLCDSMQPLARAKDLRLTRVVPEGLTVLGDRDALIRLFGNLLENALKYTERGAVDIAAREGANGNVSVQISDTGKGIAAEHLPHLFDRFYRADPSRASPGVGLGLAIAQEIARRHAGRIVVSSQPGQGSRFTVSLPMSVT